MSEMELTGVELRPLGTRLLVKVLGGEKEKSGLIIPDSAKERPQEGRVVATGEEVKGITVDDRVLYGKYSGTEIKINGFDHIILHLDDIIAVVI